MPVLITSVDQARQVVREFESVGYAMRKGQAAWGAAVFGPILAIPGVLVAIPVTAHAVLKTNPAPIALLGTLFFGWIGYAAIRTVRRYKAAKRFLRQYER